MDLQAKTKKNIWLLAAVILSVCVVYYMLTPLFEHPGNILLAATGDGGKNYFAYLYHILWEKGIWFGGLNYPYGDHVIYTDNQPLLSIPLSYIKSVIPIDVTTALVIMHYSLVLSYILGIVFVYRILVTCEVRPLPAMLFAPLVIIMSPQLFKIGGHFALCHVFFIPALLYFLLRYTITKRWKYPLYIAIVTALMMLLHPYYGGLSLFVVMLYMIGYCLFTPIKFTERIKDMLPVFSGLMLGLGPVELFIKITDPITDRPIMPHGLLEYITEDHDFLSSAYSPISRIIHERGWYAYLSESSEGFSYIGIVSITVLAIAGCIWCLGIIKRLVKNSRPENHEQIVSSRLWLFIAIAALMFAKGIPFKWHMLWLTDYIFLFRQFRALGRFSWIFYYIATIYSIVFVCRYYSLLLQKKKVLAYAFILLPLGLWCYEAKGYLAWIKEKSTSYAGQYEWFFLKNTKNWNDFLTEHRHKPTDFQALLVLPYTHFGTEKVWLNIGYDWAMVIGYRAAMQLRLPMIDANTSRLSWSQGEKQLRTAGGPWADKTMLQDLTDKRPFLLMKYDLAPLTPEQLYLLSGADSIGYFDQYYLYTCYPDRIRHNDSMQYASIKPAHDNMGYVDTCLSYKGAWYIEHFDKYTGSDNIFSKGSLPMVMKHERMLSAFDLTTADTGKLYEISCWALLERKNYKSPDISYELLDSTGAVISQGAISLKESTDNNGGLWFRAGNYFTIPGKCKKVQVKLVDNELPSYSRIDEIMLRPADAIILSKEAGGRAMVNNHIYKPR